MGSAYEITRYKPIIWIIKNDLKLIDNVSVSWSSHMPKNVAGSADWFGNIVKVVRGHSHKETIGYIAHELRHVWQVRSKTVTSVNGQLYWNNEEVDFQKIWHGGRITDAYRNIPYEVDANAYEHIMRSVILRAVSCTPYVEKFRNGNINYTVTVARFIDMRIDPYRYPWLDTDKVRQAVNAYERNRL